MPNDDNIQLQPVELTSKDFSNGLDNSFGIQDTKVMASQELNDFLMGETPSGDPNKVKKADEPEKKEDPAKKETTDTKANPDSTKTKEELSREALENHLFNTDSEDPDKQTDKKDTTKDNTAPTNDETFTTLSKDLMRLGVFTPGEDETEDTVNVKNGTDFLERFRAEQKKGAVSILDNFLGQFGEPYREAFDAIFVKGVDPIEYLNTFAKIESVKELDLTDEGNQKKVLREYYRSQLKWDDAKIDNKIEKLKDYGELEDEAKSYQEVLINKEKEKEESLIQNKTKELEDKKIRKATTIAGYQKILTEKLQAKEINGIPLNQKDAQDVLNYLANEPYKLESGELLSEYDKDILELNKPENLELKIMNALLMRRKFDLKGIKTAAISKKSDELFTVTAKNAKKEGAGQDKMRSFF